MTDPSRPFAVVGLLLVLIAVACTSSDAGHAQPTAAATPAPTPRGWMLSSGHVFGQGLTATRLPDGDPQRMGLANDMVVVDAAWSEPGNTAFAFVQSGDQNALQLERVGMSGTATPIGDPIRDFSAIAAAGSVLLVSSCADGNGDTVIAGTKDLSREPWTGTQGSRHIDTCHSSIG